MEDDSSTGRNSDGTVNVQVRLQVTIPDEVGLQAQYLIDPYLVMDPSAAALPLHTAIAANIAKAIGRVPWGDYGLSVDVKQVDAGAL